jgi:hypothetical protein|tara:strand:+ start:585 stop:812 length:228 start_codon:yes stop_codon:yes gene_type:complete
MKQTPKDREFIAKKIRKLKEEGMEQKQAVAVAMRMLEDKKKGPKQKLKKVSKQLAKASKLHAGQSKVTKKLAEEL